MMNQLSYLARFNYQLHGPENGRKWVFLHGLMGYGSNWRKIISGMPDERILTFDQRGHGRSWQPASGYTGADYAEDLYLILQELAWDSIFLVGHSMGGRNALSFAQAHPQMLRALVIVDIGPDSQPDAIDYYKKMLALIPTPFLQKLQAKEFFLNTWPQLGFVHENVMALGQYLYSNLEEKSDGTVDWRFSKEAILASAAQIRGSDAWEQLKALSVPTLIIRGENSDQLSRETFERMKQSNAHLQGIQVNNAGHWVHSDQSQEFLRILLEFAKTSGR